MSSSTETLKLRTDAIEWREVEGEIVAIDLRTSTYLAANRTATALWPALVEGTTDEALVEALVKRFGVEPEQAASEVEAFVSTLRGQGLLT